MRVQNRAMRPRIEQSVGFELTVNFNQRLGDPAQQSGRYWLIVDEAAAAPVGRQGSPDHQLRVGRDILFGQDGQCRMLVVDMKFGGDRRPARRRGGPAPNRRVRPAPVQARRAGWICRRRFRRSAPSIRARKRATGARSGRHRGSRGRPASLFRGTRAQSNRESQIRPGRLSSGRVLTSAPGVSSP